MPRWGMVIDLDKCTGCQACTAACMAENNAPVVEREEASLGRTIHWNEVLYPMEGEYPRVKARTLPLPCMHCDNPPCVRVCPVGATYKSQQYGSIVRQDYSRCIGCRLCVAACPYSRRYFNWRPASYPETLREALNPDVPVRPLGVVEKCLFCEQRLEKAEERARAEGREVKDGDWLPACVQACPARARYFGDLDNPNSTVSELSHSPRAFRLLEEIGTFPKVSYLMEGESRRGL